MAEKPIVLLAFASQSSKGEEILREKEKIISLWQDQQVAELQILASPSAQSLHETLALIKDRLLLVHLAADTDTYPGSKNGESDWESMLGKAPWLACVFLSGCAQAERVGTLLEKGVNSVLASQYSGDKKAVLRFAEMFYAQLLGQASLLNAFEKSGDTIAEKYGWKELPGATFFEKEKLVKAGFAWGLYLYPAHQDVLSWKLYSSIQRMETPLPQSVNPPAPPLAPDKLQDLEKLIDREVDSAPGGGNLFSKLFKDLFKSKEPETSRSERPDSSISPAAPVPGASGGLESHTDIVPAADISARFEWGRQHVSPDVLPELLALEARWESLSTSFREKTLVKKAVEGRLPFLELTKGRIEEIIAQALEEELFELHRQLIEKELDVLLQPQSRGLLLRQPISKADVGKYHALIIGINQYDDSDIRSLTGALADAQALHKLLSEKYFFDHIQLLENPDRNAIIDAFDELDFQATEGDNVLIFYAGHGKWDEESGIGYWLPRNADDDRSRNWIENSTIHNAIKRLKPCQHILLISDSCFSGALLDTREVAGPAIRQEDKEIRILYDAKSRQILTSGAKEPVPDNSSFFKYLIETLEKLPEKTLATHSLFYHVRSKVLNDVRQGQNPQVGKILHAGDDGGDFVFFRR